MTIEEMLEKRERIEPCAEKIASAFSAEELEGIVYASIVYPYLLVLSGAAHSGRLTVNVNEIALTRAANEKFQRVKYYLSNNTLRRIGKTISCQSTKDNALNKIWDNIHEESLMIAHLRELLSRQ